MAPRVFVLLGTKKGAFTLESDATRRSWSLRGPFCETWPMNHVVADADEIKVAITGTNPRPVLLEGTAELTGGGLDEHVFKGLDALVRDQIMPMKTTFPPGHYRRRVAGVLARRLLVRLFES